MSTTLSVTHRICLGPPDSSGPVACFLDGRQILSTRHPMRDVSAWLMEAGHAHPDDVLEIWASSDRLAESGRVGAARRPTLTLSGAA